MSTVMPLRPEALYRRCDPDQFTFETTAQLQDLDEIIGQDRVVDAVRFGIGIRREGYNLFALGPDEIGKRSVLRRFLERKAATEPTPPDWCYVNNFDQSNRPLAFSLPAGQGGVLRNDVEQFVRELHSALRTLFESEDYRTRKQVIEEESKEEQDKAFEELRKQGQQNNIELLRTPVGLVFAPAKNGEVMDREEFQKLPEEEQKRIDTSVASLQERLREIIRLIPRWEREGRERIRQLNREVTLSAVDHLIEELQKKYSSLPKVVKFLDTIQRDVVDNVEDFLGSSQAAPGSLLGMDAPRAAPGPSLLRRYQVNLIVDHSGNQGAPVVYEDLPTYQNLIGQVEHIAHMGTLVTDFNLIKAGALHRANGGYLMLDAAKVLLQPYAWEGLKRILRSGEIRIESLGQMLSLVSTVSLEPEPIPVQVKVVLLGERLLYYLLCQFDPEFNKLFKVAVDFEERMDRNPDNDHLLARLIGSLARREGLRPLDRGAVTRVIEQSSRLVSDAEKLSLLMGTLTDLLREADYWAGESGRSAISAGDVRQAIDAQIRRTDRVRNLLQEEVRRGTILIDTDGARTGQVNGLSVVSLGQSAFGHPSRITARVRLGKGEVIDIEREVELGGPIHSKGVLILSGFLGARYAPEQPLSLSASLVFEQSYGGVEGDSASSAELYALLSALAEVPIRQSLAVTGSVNQHGQVQAIGGVNEKIEGFFDLCRARGLTGEQGVLIPASNVKHLMLRRDVVDAAAAGKFSIYPVETIDQGIEILTGLPAGERDASGKFPEGTVNQKVDARLAALAQKRAALNAPAQAGEV